MRHAAGEARRRAASRREVTGRAEAPVVDPPEDGADRASTSTRSTTSSRSACILDNVRDCYERARRRALALDADSGPLQGLHRAAQAEHVPVAAHDRDRSVRRAHGGADPHARDAPRSPSRASPRTGGTRKGASQRRRRRSEAFAWLRQLLEWQRELKDPTEFLDTVKMDLFADEVFVFTPKGDVNALPQGRDADRLRLRDPHARSATLRGRARERRDRAAALRAAQRRHRRDHHVAQSQKPSKDWLGVRRHVVARRRRSARYLRIGRARRSRSSSAASSSSASCKQLRLTLNRTQKSGEMDKALAQRQGGDRSRSS